MRTEMDLLALGDFLLWKAEQPPGQEHKGHLDDRAIDPDPFDDRFVAELVNVWRNNFVHVASRLRLDQPELFSPRFGEGASAWMEHADLDAKAIFEFPNAMLEEEINPSRLAAAITGNWSHAELARALTPVLRQLLEIGEKFALEDELDEDVSDAVYVMF